MNINDIFEREHSRAEMHLDLDSISEISMVLTTKDIWYTLENSNLVDGNSKDFTINSGLITYTGTRSKIFLFTGTSNANSSSMLAELDFGLFKNDVLVEGCVTPVQFSTQDRNKTFVCSQILAIEPGDVIKVKAKTDINGVTARLQSFSITFWGI